MDPVTALRQNILQIAQQSSQMNWTQGLNTRKRAELEFHNKDRDRALTNSLPSDTYELLHGNKKYYSTVAASRHYVESWLARHTKGKVFLDYACGNGGQAIRAAKAGAALAVGLDISNVSVQNGNQDAATQGVGERCIFVQGDCEATGLPDNTFDVILCSGMLHHLDLSYAFPELRRILKPGGRILAVEALNYNPAIKAYRVLTPSMRTEWEKNHILSLKDIRFAKRFFQVGEIRYWHYLSIFCAYLPSATRGLALRLCDGIDALLSRVPLVRLMAWQFTFELIKKSDD
ncbi:MAG: class I SAM-dependent methyltransferase [Bdellovibrionales bacterium]